MIHVSSRIVGHGEIAFFPDAGVAKGNRRSLTAFGMTAAFVFIREQPAAEHLLKPDTWNLTPDP
jgi:hypothetical protein